MSADNKPQSLFKVLDNFFITDGDASLDQLHQISTLLNAETEPMFKIQEKFNFYSAYASASKIQKILELLEFLSVFSPRQLSKIINDEKFMDNFCSGIMEPDYQSELLNLLKLWSEKYQENKSEVHRVFELIENLTSIGMGLPDFFLSKYDGLEKEIESFLKENKKTENQTSDLEMGKNEKPVQESYEMEIIESGTLGSLNKPPSPAKDTSSFDRHFKEKFPFMMGIDDFLTYKTMPCGDQMKCQMAPSMRRGIVIGVRKKEIKCPYWHNMQDRRRPLFDKKGNLMYGYTSCENKEDCVKGDNCKQAHNFFETFYHPLRYKKGRCVLLKSCKNTKYCPYSHSNEEQRAWSNIVKEYFNLQEEEDEVVWAADSGDEGDTERYERPAPPSGPANGTDSSNIFNNSKNQHEKSSNMQPIDPELLTKELKCTLVVRKEYVEAKALTSLFENNVCFQHFPVLGGAIIQLENKDLSSQNQENINNKNS